MHIYVPKLALAFALVCIFVIMVAAFQQTPMNSVAIMNSKVNTTPIGQDPGGAAAGSFTTLGTSGASTFGPNMTVNGSVTASGGFLGNASSASAVPWSGVSGKPPVTLWNWQWSGQGGQPSYVWGSNDGSNMYVWNPGNFSVNYANSANTANVATSANSVQWANVQNRPYPVATQTWNWSPQPGQAYMWGTPDAQNMYPYNPANFSVNYSNSTGYVPWAGVGGPPAVTTWNWQYAGQGGQPTWLWGTNNGSLEQVWNPASFSVNYANSANVSNSATNATNASNVPWAGVSGKPPVTTWNWVWQGQAGQPSYVWGSNDGSNFYVWTPSNFNVNHATSADNATTANGLIGFQAFTTGRSCSTSNQAYAQCSSTFNLPIAYADGNYVITCSPEYPGGYPTLIGANPINGSQFNVTIMNGSSNGAQVSNAIFNCMAKHP